MSPITNDNDNETWGQFIDIENGFLIPEQVVTDFKTNLKPRPITIPTPIPITKPIPIPITKPILKQPSIKSLIRLSNPKPDPKKLDSYNEALDKIIERQIYLGCFICILTLGLFIMP